MTDVPTVPFHDGQQIPQLGLGVWQVEDDVADERGRAVVEGDPAQIEVVVGLAARGEGDPTADDGEFVDEVEQLLGFTLA